jgi:hypothetical protein
MFFKVFRFVCVWLSVCVCLSIDTNLISFHEYPYIAGMWSSLIPKASFFNKNQTDRWRVVCVCILLIGNSVYLRILQSSSPLNYQQGCYGFLTFFSFVYSHISLGFSADLNTPEPSQIQLQARMHSIISWNSAFATQTVKELTAELIKIPAVFMKV